MGCQFKAGRFRGRSVLCLDADQLREGLGHYRDNDIDVLMLLLDDVDEVAQLEILREYPGIRGISITGGDCDIAPLAELTRLEILVLGDFRGELDLGRHPALHTFYACHSGTILWPPRMEALRKLHLYTELGQLPSLKELPECPDLRVMVLDGGELTALDGIERFPNLEMVGLKNLRKLADFSALRKLRSLDTLNIVNCPLLRPPAEPRHFGHVRHLQYRCSPELLAEVCAPPREPQQP